jgi:hypothetical protein
MGRQMVPARVRPFRPCRRLGRERGRLDLYRAAGHVHDERHRHDKRDGGQGAWPAWAGTTVHIDVIIGTQPSLPGRWWEGRDSYWRGGRCPRWQPLTPVKRPRPHRPEGKAGHSSARDGCRGSSRRDSALCGCPAQEPEPPAVRSKPTTRAKAPTNRVAGRQHAAARGLD